MARLKRLYGLLILVLLVNACATNVAHSALSATELFPPKTSQSEAGTIQQATTTPPPGVTEAFITQVMATKYAARTQYAALPTITPTPTIPPDSPDCRSSDLQISFNTNGAGMHIVLEVGVTNIGNTPCFVPSWPVINLLDRSGKALDIVYDYITINGAPSSLPPTQVGDLGEEILFGLANGQTASLILPWGNWCPGAIEGGVIIRMFLLGSSGWIDIPTDITGGGYCNDPTSPSTLEVIGFGY